MHFIIVSLFFIYIYFFFLLWYDMDLSKIKTSRNAGKSPIPNVRRVMWSSVSESCHVIEWTLTPVASSSRCCFFEVRSWAAISSSYCVSSCFLHTALWKHTLTTKYTKSTKKADNLLVSYGNCWTESLGDLQHDRTDGGLRKQCTKSCMCVTLSASGGYRLPRI